MTEIHSGGCQCGALRYEVEGQPAKAALCHCRYCQMRTGSAFGVSAYFPSDKLRILQGTLKDYSFRTESGRGFTQRFCPECGCTVLWNIEAFPDLTGVAAGTFDPPTFWFDVKREVFARSKAPFVHTDIEDSSETSSSYVPTMEDAPHLRGG